MKVNVRYISARNEFILPYGVSTPIDIFDNFLLTLIDPEDYCKTSNIISYYKISDESKLQSVLLSLTLDDSFNLLVK
jgi:hypothetical protein